MTLKNVSTCCSESMGVSCLTRHIRRDGGVGLAKETESQTICLSLCSRFAHDIYCSVRQLRFRPRYMNSGTSCVFSTLVSTSSWVERMLGDGANGFGLLN